MLPCRLGRYRFSFRRKPSPSAAMAVHRQFPSDFVPADVVLTKRSVLKMRTASHSETQFTTNHPRKPSELYLTQPQPLQQSVVWNKESSNFNLVWRV